MFYYCIQFVTACAWHAWLKGYLLTYLLTWLMRTEMFTDLSGSVISVFSAWQGWPTSCVSRYRHRWAAAARLFAITDLLSAMTINTAVWLVLNGTFSTNRPYHDAGVWNVLHRGGEQEKHTIKWKSKQASKLIRQKQYYDNINTKCKQYNGRLPEWNPSIELVAYSKI